VLPEGEEVLGGVEVLDIQIQESQQAMEPVVAAAWEGMEQQPGVQVLVELVKLLEVLLDMLVLAMAMEVVKVVMAPVLHMEEDVVVAMGTVQVVTAAQQGEELVVGAMDLVDMGILPILQAMEIIHGDQQEQTPTTLQQ
jgi:hypothetical protein